MKYLYTIALALMLLPSVSSAKALTSQQSSSLIAVVQSSPVTPASAFVPLITEFSSITTTQAETLIRVVQAAPGVPADAFINLLMSFTEDKQPVVINDTPAPTPVVQKSPVYIPENPSTEVPTVAPQKIFMANIDYAATRNFLPSNDLEIVSSKPLELSSIVLPEGASLGEGHASNAHYGPNGIDAYFYQTYIIGMNHPVVTINGSTVNISEKQ